MQQRPLLPLLNHFIIDGFRDVRDHACHPIHVFATRHDAEEVGVIGNVDDAAIMELFFHPYAIVGTLAKLVRDADALGEERGESFVKTCFRERAEKSDRKSTRLNSSHRL